jgi:hypothetical protein
MMQHYENPEERHEKIAALVGRYRNGEFSEVVFIASLAAAGMRRDNISALVSQHRAAFVESLPYLRGDVS